MIDYLKHKIKPYLDIITTAFLDGVLVVTILTIYKYVSIYMADVRMSESDKHTVDNIIWMVHTLIVVLLAIYIVTDIGKAIIKCLSELHKDWDDFRNKK